MLVDFEYRLIIIETGIIKISSFEYFYNASLRNTVIFFYGYNFIYAESSFLNRVRVPLHLLIW